MSTWREHPLCASPTPWPARFWGPERLDPTAWRELAGRLIIDDEIARLCAVLAGADRVIDVGGGTGLLTQALAAQVAPVTIVEPSAEQRAHLPPGLTAIAGRAEAVPLPDASADAAIATWVLQYCDDPAQAVRELARLARRRVAIVQAAPDNHLVDIYNAEAAIAGLPPAHHGWLLALAAETLGAAGFAIELTRVRAPVRVAPAEADAVADTLARLHFAGHPALAAMRTATAPMIAAFARGGSLVDDGVLLLARRPR
ncbi:MAG: class I SAM-dependent methyltransferase [Kofleriaceae bacterium]|jgi:SAM-dependent methyltransferase|nr:class I SAM-dependent methyltransferase [Kofleriaceae bacterium]